MIRSFVGWIAVMMLAAGLLAGCGDTVLEKPATTVTDTFESGSIGTVTRIDDTEWELSLADDNDNPGLPDSRTRGAAGGM